MMLKVALILSIIFIFPSLVFAEREHPEKWYQERWCREQGGRIEVVFLGTLLSNSVFDHMILIIVQFYRGFFRIYADLDSARRGQNAGCHDGIVFH